MTCSMCSLNHPTIHRASALIAYLDPKVQANVNVSNALFFAEDCAKAIAQGFERFQMVEDHIFVLVRGKKIDLGEHNGFENGEVMETDHISIEIIGRLKRAVA